VTAVPDASLVSVPEDASEIPVDLPDRVDAHMRAHFPDDADAGGWICARDYRDNTAVVVWRSSGNAELLPGGARAVVITRWHMSLQNDGFISNPRTDMEVFGRPDEQSDDGRARWLHITGWDPGLMVEPRSIYELAAELRQKIGARRRP
jgi:hypothetical protein